MTPADKERIVIDESNVVAIHAALEESHAALLRYKDHDGSAHCGCHTAALIRLIEETFGTQTFRPLRKYRKKSRL